MRRISIFEHMTPEGYFADADGHVHWFIHDEDAAADSMERFPGTDTCLFGRRTYEMMASFWPNVTEGSPSMLAMARWLAEATKIVFSRTLAEATWRNTRIVRDLDPRAIEAIRREPGKGILVLGSGSIVSQLAQHGLVDEYQLLVAPVLLGAGRPLWRDVSTTTPLALADVKKYPSGNLMLRYTRGT